MTAQCLTLERSPGTSGKTVEADETFFGHLQGQPKKGPTAWVDKNVVPTLVERGGSTRSFHVDGVGIADLQPIIRANLGRETKLMTDEMQSYKEIGREFTSHETVNYRQDEYVRGT